MEVMVANGYPRGASGEVKIYRTGMVTQVAEDLMAYSGRDVRDFLSDCPSGAAEVMFVDVFKAHRQETFEFPIAGSLQMEQGRQMKGHVAGAYTCLGRTSSAEPMGVSPGVYRAVVYSPTRHALVALEPGQNKYSHHGTSLQSKHSARDQEVASSKTAPAL
tara:strand:+ start:3824 stop:4306 length:483 start_codon:yes stop_codon:yes gene_type:complete